MIKELSIQELNESSIRYVKFWLNSMLAPYISYCWFITIDKEYGDFDGDIHIPDGLMEIIFVFEGRYSKTTANGTAHSKVIEKSSILGVQTCSNLISGLEKIRMLGVKLTPLGYSLFFEKEVSIMPDTSVSLDSIGLAWLNELQEKLEPLREIKNIANLLSHTFLKQLNPNYKDFSIAIMSSCINQIEKHRGNITVGELSSIHNKGIRQIQRYFSQNIGISPKNYINILRFRYLYEGILKQGINPSTFLDLGYYDQSHFINDFRKRIGISPTELSQKNMMNMNRIARINLG